MISDKKHTKKGIKGKSMKKTKQMTWIRLCATAAVMTLAVALPVLAEEANGGEEAPRNQWINMSQGPGVAQWVDENGVVTETPGVKNDTSEKSPQEPDETAGEGQPAQEASQAQEGQTAQASQAQAGQTAEASQAQAGQAAQASQAQAGQAAEASQAQTGQAAQAQTGQAAEAAQAKASNQATGRTIDPNRPMVALTFDDGPYAPVGNQIMDCLAQYGGKATFYVVGNRCASYTAEMQRMAAEGHEIGNHTYEHKYLHKLGADQIRYQINKGSEAIQAASGVVPATVRLPGGNKNATVLANVSAPIIMWNIDTLDWKTKNTQNTVNHVLSNVKDGDIVLMHELYSQTGNAAVQIIPALVERGYQLVTVSELAQYRGGLQGGQIYYSFRP